MITVYQDPGGSTQGMSSLQISNIFFMHLKSVKNIFLMGYVKIITIFHRVVGPNYYSITLGVWAT